MRRAIQYQSKSWRITAPVDREYREKDGPVEPLGEKEFEEQMRIGFKRED
jgi:hypothetical protein